MLLDEAEANLTFSQYKLGHRYQVDIHDPAVAGLIKAGYLRIIWKEAPGDSSGNLVGAESLPADGVDFGLERPASADETQPAAAQSEPGEEALDVADTAGPVAGGAVRTPRRGAAHTADK